MQGAFDPAALLGIGDVRFERRRDLRPCRQLVVGLEQPAPAADHLAERPERDPVPVRRGAPVVPPDGLDEAVDVLEELPREAALADSGRADDGDEAWPLLAARRVEEVLEEPQLGLKWVMVLGVGLLMAQVNAEETPILKTEKDRVSYAIGSRPRRAGN